MLNDFVGSPGFFAPELMMRRQYDGAIADMWSMGAVMVRATKGCFNVTSTRVFSDRWYHKKHSSYENLRR